MLLVVLLCSLSLSVLGQQANEDWLDPYDMLNYDSSTKSMRKSAEIEDQQKTIASISQQPTCHPVFKRFLSRLLKEIKKVGVPSDSTDVFYDAKIKLSSQAMTVVKELLEGGDRWRTGALDNALSQILVDLKPHNYEAWKWRFEDTFGVELDTVIKISTCVLIIVAIICTQLWSTVSWFVQFSRLFAVCFFVSIIWNWFYLYKIAFAEHQNNIVKMDSVNEKCTGMKKIDWSDSLKEWFRSTWTLQDDPCQRYYEVLMVNPILLVPPTKAISVTITTFITEPLKHFGQGISEFLRALLKDLPVTLQVPVLLTIVLAIVVCMYGSVQAAFQHGIMAPLRRPRRDPPHPGLEHPPHHPPMIEDDDHFAGGDAPAALPRQPPRHPANNARLNRNQVNQRPPNRTRSQPARTVVETVRPADRQNGEDERDSEQCDKNPEVDQNLSAESGSENPQKTPEELKEATGDSVAANTAKPKPTEPDLSQLKKKPSKEKLEPSKDSAAPKPQPAERRSSQPDVQDLEASDENKTAPVSQAHVETVGVPVQETCPSSEE